MFSPLLSSWGFLLFFAFFYFLVCSILVDLESGLMVSLEIFDFDLASLNLSLILDKFSIIFCSIVMLISGVVMFYSIFYMSNMNSNRFTYLVVLFFISMLVLIFGGNFFLILLGWDGLGVVSFSLVIYYQNEISVKSGLLTILMNRFGDSAMILFMCFFYMNEDMVYSVSVMMNEDEKLGILLFIMGCFTKSAQFPFMSWLPAAMTAPTPVSSLVHSSTLVTAGIYLLIRFNYFLLDEFFFGLMFLLGLLTMGVGGLLAMLEVDFKKIVAFSTLSQLGLLVFILSLGEKSICFFHLISHAIFKSFLFMICGIFMGMSFGSQDSRLMGIKYPSGMLFHIILLFLCVNLSGFPISMGFLSKDLILESLLGGPMSVMYMLFFFFFCCFSVCYSFGLFFSILSLKSVGFSNLFSDFLFGWKFSLMVLFFILVFGGIFFEEILIDLDFYSYFQDFKVLDLFIFIFSFIIYNMKVYLKSLFYMILDYFWVSIFLSNLSNNFYNLNTKFGFNISYNLNWVFVDFFGKILMDNYIFYFYLFSMKNFFYFSFLFLFYFLIFS